MEEQSEEEALDNDFCYIIPTFQGRKIPFNVFLFFTIYKKKYEIFSLHLSYMNYQL